jgi:hypothetical protein
VEAVDLPERDFAAAINYEHSAVARARVWLGFPQHAIRSTHFSMRPEVAAQGKVERPDLPLPLGGIHDGIHTDPNYSAVGGGKPVSL